MSNTTHPEAVGGTSQKHKLYGLLKDYLWHDTLEIMARVYNLQGHEQGIVRISARIHDLKKDGWEIESRKKVGAVWEYRLQNPEPKQTHMKL